MNRSVPPTPAARRCASALPTLLLAALLAANPAAARPPVIDVHVHTDPSHYGDVLEVLAATGVTRFVNLSGGSVGDGLEEALDGAAPYDRRVLVCANVRWREYAASDFGEKQAAALAEAARLGAACLKIPKVLGLGLPDPDRPDHYMAVDDARLDPIWAAAGRLGLPVFIHTSDPKAFWEPVTPANERYAELSVHPGWSFAGPEFPSRETLLAQRDHLLEKHLGTIFVGVHLANNPEDLDYVDRTMAAHPNLWVDVSARVPEIGRHDPAKARALFVKYQDRVLFGTDLGFGRQLMLGSVGANRPNIADLFLFYADIFRFFETRDRSIPHPTPIQGDWRIDAIGLPEDVLVKLYLTNALRLLWHEAGPSAVDREALEQARPLSSFF